MKVSAHKCRNIAFKFPIIGWAIMMAQGMMPWREDSSSHMTLQLGEYYYNITFTGFHKVHETKFLETYKITASHTFSVDVTFIAFQDWVNGFVNHKYDFLQIYGLLKKAMGFVAVNNTGNDFKQMICSELPLAFVVNFYDYKINDPDSYDLNSTWNIILKH